MTHKLPKPLIALTIITFAALQLSLAFADEKKTSPPKPPVESCDGKLQQPLPVRLLQNPNPNQELAVELTAANLGKLQEYINKVKPENVSLYFVELKDDVLSAVKQAPAKVELIRTDTAAAAKVGSKEYPGKLANPQEIQKLRGVINTDTGDKPSASLGTMLRFKEGEKQHIVVFLNKDAGVSLQGIEDKRFSRGLTIGGNAFSELLRLSYELYQSQDNTAPAKTKEALKEEADKKLNEWFKDTAVDPLILETIGIKDTKSLTFQDFAKKAKQTIESMPQSKEKTAFSDKLRRFANDMIKKHHVYQSNTPGIYDLLFLEKGNCVARNTLYTAVLNTLGITATTALTNVHQTSDHLICIVESSRLNPETNKHEKKYEISEIGNPFKGTPRYLSLQVPLTSGEIKEVRATELTTFQSQRNKEYEIDFGNQYPVAGAYHSRGFAYSCFGEYQKAIEDYNKAIKLSPNFAGVYNNRGFARYKLGKYQEAIADYTKAAALSPKDAEVYYNRGATWHKLGKYQEAIEDYNKAIKLNPKFAEAHSNCGLVYSKLGEYQKAIEDYDKAIELNPKDAEVYYNRGVGYLRLGKRQDAYKDFAAATRLDTKYAKILKDAGIRLDGK